MTRVVLKHGQDLLALTMIARRLRAADREEIYGISDKESPDELAMRTYMSGKFQWIAWLGGEPVAAIGAHSRWEGVWTCWAFGTDKWNRVAVSLTKHVLRVMIPALLESGAHRVECHASAAHTDARRWLRWMGAKQGEKLDFFGKTGQTYYCYWWDRRSAGKAIRRHLPASSVSRPKQT
jgi:hypothetical protein